MGDIPNSLDTAAHPVVAGGKVALFGHLPLCKSPYVTKLIVTWARKAAQLREQVVYLHDLVDFPHHPCYSQLTRSRYPAGPVFIGMRERSNITPIPKRLYNV